MSKELIMEINDDEYQKYLVWRLEQIYQLNGESTVENIQEIKDTISKQLDKDQTRLDLAIDQVEDLIKKKQFAYKEAVEYAVKKTLNHFPEHLGRTTRLMEVSGHGSFTIDLDTGEYLSGKQHLYDDWVEGKIKPPELPEPIKINFKRLAILAFPLILATGFIITSAVTFVNRNFGALEINEYRFAKPGDKHYKPWTPNGY
jgi:hypothetical protein